MSRELYVCETLSLDNNGLSGDYKPEGFFSSDTIIRPKMSTDLNNFCFLMLNCAI